MFTTFSLIFIIITGIVCQKQAPQCPVNGVLVPSFYKLEQAALGRYPFVEGGLQIYRNRQIECSGWLVEWHFISKTQTIRNTYLAVFRERVPLSLEFDIVNVTFINEVTLPERSPGRMDFLTLNEPFPVQAGDFLGIFYEDFEVGEEGFSIVMDRAIDNVPSGFPPTHVIMTDVKRGLFASGGFVNATGAPLNYRNPALTAVITQNNPTVTKPPQTPPTTTTTTQAPTTTPIILPTLDPHFWDILPQPRMGNQQMGSIPARCLMEHRNDTSCQVQGWRFFFDVKTNKCRGDLGCNLFSDEENDFSSLSECNEYCKQMPSTPSSAQGNDLGFRPLPGSQGYSMPMQQPIQQAQQPPQPQTFFGGSQNTDFGNQYQPNLTGQGGLGRADIMKLIDSGMSGNAPTSMGGGGGGSSGGAGASQIPNVNVRQMLQRSPFFNRPLPGFFSDRAAFPGQQYVGQGNQ